jgi:GGDEF domain-containing protein
MKYHHEKYDGTGYPYGLAGDEIPLLSHIMIVADAFDAMTSNRIYQKRKTFQEALNEINRYKGVWYQPDIVDAIEKVAQKDLIEVSETSQIPLTKMEHERFSYFFKDQMTGFYNEPYLWMIINKQIPHYIVTDFFMIELHGMSDYNKINGWHSGNILLNNISQIILKRYDRELIFRLFGDDFLICFTSREAYIGKSKEWKEIKIGNVYSSSKTITKTMLIEELQSMW